MAQLNKLTYENKSNPVPVVNRQTQATAEDFNEIKAIVNAAVDGINWIKCDAAELVAGDNPITFIAPYPVGIEFKVVVITCTDADGYYISNRIISSSESGFVINVSKVCTLVYLAVPRR